MDKAMKARVAFALKCKVEEVPDNLGQLKQALDDRRAALKAEKLRKVKDGESVH